MGCLDQVSQIACNGKAIPLTASLRDGLRRVRVPDSARNLCADQVCINQNDLTERGHQIVVMWRIYKKSRRTLVHLGNADDHHVDEVYSLIEDVNKMLKDQLFEMNRSRIGLPEVPSHDPIASDHRWESIHKMMDCAWFGRAWVVQEAGLSSRPQILYGKRNIDWESCCDVLLWPIERGLLISYKFGIKQHEIHADRVNVWSNLDSLQAELEGAPSSAQTALSSLWSLLDILRHGRTCKVTEQSDRIYAFLAIITLRIS